MDDRTLVLVVERTERDETRTFRFDLDKAAYLHAKCPDDLFYTQRYVTEALRMRDNLRHREDTIYVARRSFTNNPDEFEKIAADEKAFFRNVLVIEATEIVDIDHAGHYHFV